MNDFLQWLPVCGLAVLLAANLENAGTKKAAHLRGRLSVCGRGAVQTGVVTRSMRVSGRASSALAAFCITKLNFVRVKGALTPSDS